MKIRNCPISGANWDSSGGHVSCWLSNCDRPQGPMTVPLRQDFSAAGVRKLAVRAKDVSQIRRLLSIAAIYDGMNRTEAARIGGQI